MSRFGIWNLEDNWDWNPSISQSILIGEPVHSSSASSFSIATTSNHSGIKSYCSLASKLASFPEFECLANISDGHWLSCNSSFCMNSLCSLVGGFCLFSYLIITMRSSQHIYPKRLKKNWNRIIHHFRKSAVKLIVFSWLLIYRYCTNNCK